MGASTSVIPSASQSLGASGKLSASTQSGRASQNFAAVVGVFMRAYENGDINVPEIKAAIEGLSVALDKDPKLKSAVDLSFIAKLKDWKKGNEHLFPHVQLAVYCAKEVYDLRTKQAIDDRKAKQPPGSQSKLVEGAPAELLKGDPASYLQNTKNWALFKDAKSNNLYFSVRGTSTTGFAATQNQGKFKAHRGFLEVAEAMFPTTKAAVLNAAKGLTPKPTLVFCGHSAGGGTAFFLYHFFQMRTTQAERDTFQAVHCMTFGSAAIASIPNPVHSKRTDDRILSFINVNDPVPRAELPYADWLAETLGRYLAIRQGNTNVPPYSALPNQILYPGGEMVLLDEGGEVAGKLEPGTLSGKAFLDLAAHNSLGYKNIVSQLLK